jgi:23S rRNA pseudouridine2605 synthase
MRLNKFLARAGIASRRNADMIIQEGRVSINGKTITALGTQVNESRDKVSVDGKPIALRQENVYIMLHKPVSYLVTCADNFGRQTVLDLIGKYRNMVKPVGRLDLNSSGLLVLTNDGELAFRLTHPRYQIDKTYVVKCEGVIGKDKVLILENGIQLESGRTSPAKVELLGHTNDFSRLQITIHEGRKRQIRLMLQAVGHKVLSLKRVAFGNLTLGDLLEGDCRRLNAGEVEGVKKLVEL